MLLYAVIPVKNQLHYTAALVEQLLGQGEGRVLVIDNGSTDATVPYLRDRKHENLDWISMATARIHGMWNRGLEWAYEHARGMPHSVALLNNDLRLTCTGFLGRLDAVLRSHSRVGVAGANYDGRKMPEGKRAQVVTGVCGGRYDGTGGLPGFAMMLRGEECHRFPKDLHWWYGDTDLVLSLRKAGRLAVIASDATLEHLDGGGRTGQWESPEMQPLLRADRAWFERKWGAECMAR